MTMFEKASDLLAEDDPGETPFVVANLLTHQGIGALVGPYKVGKTWVVLEIVMSVAAGVPAFGQYRVSRGPVLLILEESGRSALHRRLSKLTKGRGIPAHHLSQLHFSTNRGVNLSDPKWRETILSEAAAVAPVLIVFDPLARVKGGGVDESSQLEIGPVLDFLRELRRVSGAAVLFVHHTGHESRDRMRGSSDLEAYWESKLTIKQTSEGYTIRADHREAASTEPFAYTLEFDEAEGSTRLQPVEEDTSDELAELIREYLLDHPGATNTEVRDAIPRRASGTSSRLLDLEKAGTVDRRPSERTDKGGRVRRVDTFYLTAHAPLDPVPPSGQARTTNPEGPYVVPLSRPLKGGNGNADPVGTVVS